MTGRGPAAARKARWLAMLSVCALGAISAAEQQAVTVNVAAGHSPDQHPWGPSANDLTERFLEQCKSGPDNVESGPGSVALDCRRLHEKVDAPSRYYKKENDGHARHGVDTATVLFYAGHGDFDTQKFSAVDKTVAPYQTSYGDGPARRPIRYLWMCSCHVFAHGIPEKQAYSSPTTFKPNGEGKNAFRTWRTALSGGIRLACGGSNVVCGQTEEVATEIWNAYQCGRSPADSFLVGVHRRPSAVPICISRGGADSETTPLYDRRFETDPNPGAGGDYVWAQYPVPTAGRASVPGWESLFDGPDLRLPVLTASPGVLPTGLVERVSDGSAVLAVGAAPRLSSLHLDPQSNALCLQTDEQRAAVPADEAKNWAGDAVAEELLDLLQVLEVPTTSLAVFDEKAVREEILFELQRAPACVLEGCSDPVEVARFAKSKISRRRSTITLDGQRIPTLGPGGVREVETGADGGLIAISLVAREITWDREREPLRKVKSPADARAEAWKELSDRSYDPSGYELAEEAFGYKEMGFGCSQTVVPLVYRFVFVPRSPKYLRSSPPQQLEISALADWEPPPDLCVGPSGR